MCVRKFKSQTAVKTKIKNVHTHNVRINIKKCKYTQGYRQVYFDKSLVPSSRLFSVYTSSSSMNDWKFFSPIRNVLTRWSQKLSISIEFSIEDLLASVNNVEIIDLNTLCYNNFFVWNEFLLRTIKLVENKCERNQTPWMESIQTCELIKYFPIKKLTRFKTFWNHIQWGACIWNIVLLILSTANQIEMKRNKNCVSLCQMCFFCSSDLNASRRYFSLCCHVIRPSIGI